MSHQQCPACLSANIERSRAHWWIEAFKRRWTARRIFRCHDCDWRGWLVPVGDVPLTLDAVEDEHVEPIDLEAIAAAVDRGAPGPLDAVLPETPGPEAREHGCPKCGSDVLKRAPVPFIGSFLKPFSNKRRYRCRECGWTGWKHRLRRRNSAFVARSRGNGVEPRAAWFFIAVVIFLIVVTILLLRTWNSSRPVEVPVGSPGSST